MPERILVVIAHPDDAEGFIGGTLIMKARQGADIRVVLATDGSWGSFAVPPDELAATRRAEAQRAAATFNGEVYFLGPEARGYRDGSLAAVDFDELCEQVARHIRAFRPTCVATFNAGVFDGHPDHDTIGRVALAAMQFAELPNAYPHQIAPEVSPHIVSARILFSKEQRYDNRVFDITPAVDAKVAALLAHESQSVFLATEVVAQVRSAGLGLSWLPDDVTSPEMAAALFARAIRDRARAVALKRPFGRLRGWMTGCRYAESFWYSPVPPLGADIAAQARAFERIRRLLQSIHAEWLWEIVRELIARRLT